MKKIVDYRKLLGVSRTTDLAELKTVYRNFMKEYHPDKFTGDEEQLKVAEEKSKSIIEAYHFLVSIAPETISKFSEQYANTISTSGIADFNYKAQTLEIIFQDGSSYEYFDVPKVIYSKLINADSQARFAKRHIYNSFTFRNVLKTQAVEI